MDASAQLLAPAPANTMPDAVTMPPVWVVTNMTDADALRLIPDELIVHWNLRQLFGMHVDGMQVDRTSGEDDKWPQRTLPERLATLLLVLSTADGEGARVDDVSFQDLAAVLGSRRESVAAILRAFHRQGLIHLEYGRIRLLDRTELAALGDLPAGYADA